MNNMRQDELEHLVKIAQQISTSPYPSAIRWHLIDRINVYSNVPTSVIQALIKQFEKELRCGESNSLSKLCNPQPTDLL